jgi:hypothetical protein
LTILALDLNLIPEMDDPLGKYWSQPKDIRLAPMDDEHVVLSLSQYKALAEYSSTIPTGVYPGKVWRRSQKDVELLVWYGPETPDHKCPILYRKILLA